MRPVFALLIVALLPAAAMATPAKADRLAARLEQELLFDWPSNVHASALVRVDVVERATSPFDQRVEITCIESHKSEHFSLKPCPVGLSYSGPGGDHVLGIQQRYVSNGPQFAILWESGTVHQIDVFQVTEDSVRKVFDWRGKALPELRTLADGTSAIAIVEHSEAGMPVTPAPTIFKWDGMAYQRQP